MGNVVSRKCPVAVVVDVVVHVELSVKVPIPGTESVAQAAWAELRQLPGTHM